MTEREIDDGRDYPDGSVGRYVRERWGTSGTPRSKATRPYAPPVQEPEPEPETPPRIDDTPGARTPPLGEPGVAHPNGSAPAGRPYLVPRDGEEGTDNGAHPEDRRGAHRADPDTPGWGTDATVPAEAPAAPEPAAAHRPASGQRSDAGQGADAGTDPDTEITVRAERGQRPDPGLAAEAGPRSPGSPGRGPSGGPGATGTPAGAGTVPDDPTRSEAGGGPTRAPAVDDTIDGAHPAGRPGAAPGRAPGVAPHRASDTGPQPVVPDGPRAARPGSPAAGRPSTSPWAAVPRDEPAPPSPPFSGPRFAPPPPRPGAAETPVPTPRPARDAGRWTDPGAVAAQEAQQARAEPADLSSARLLRPAKRPPQSGWRRLVYLLSGRTINPGESPMDVRRRELTARVNAPLLGCYKIAMLSLKGGVGKTTMTATLGATFASLRGDRVVAVDANPDRGTLSQKIPLETSATVRHLLRDAQRVRRYTDVRAYTSQGPSRLEVLASEQDPAVSEAFSEDDYRRTVNLLEHFYNIVLTDCGTGLMHSAMYGVLGVADQLIIVSSGSIDGARSASATMDWLDAHGHGDLVRGAVAVINSVHRSGRGVDLDRVEEHFAARCRAVVRVPFDAHLDEGAEIDLDRLEPGTRMALLELAAYVADAFDRAPAR